MNTNVVAAKKTFNCARRIEPSSALEDEDEAHFDRAREFTGRIWKDAG
jgi:hypothetical protein